MSSTEDLGFSVMVSYEAKLTMAEGVVLGAGAVFAISASYLASKSLAETREPDESAYRFMDRLAQQDPEWAISKYPEEYERGLKIAPLIEQAAKYVRELSSQGEEVVIHGRASEIIYRTVQRLPGTNMKKVHYAITSRPLTTRRFTRGSKNYELALSTPFPKKYGEYLARVVPKNAIHVDVGKEGRIPKYLDAMGFQVKSIKMIAANRKEDEIPFEEGFSHDRWSLYGEIEGSIPRLHLKELNFFDKRDPQYSEDRANIFGKLDYTPDAPGFWSRLYAVCDFMGVPRKLDVPSYEKRS